MGYIKSEKSSNTSARNVTAVQQCTWRISSKRIFYNITGKLLHFVMNYLKIRAYLKQNNLKNVIYNL